MLILIALIIILLDAIVIKIFDAEIRPYHIRKVIVIWVMGLGLILLISGIVSLFI